MKRILLLAIFILFAMSATAVCQAQSGEQKASTSVATPGLEFLQLDPAQLYKDATLAYENKEYQKAIDNYLNFIRLIPKDIDALYNLACCYALLGEDKPAADLLFLATRLGWEEVDAIENDTDFDKVRNTEYFKAKVEEIKEKIKAVQKDQGETRFIKTPAYLPYQILLPENYDKSKRYRMIIGLHGFGDKGSNFIRLWKKVDKPDFIYIVPQAPIALYMSGQIGFSWQLWDEKIGKETTDAAVEYITQVTKLLQTEYNPTETYLLGFSQGCGMTLVTGIKHPELYTGLIAFGGWLDKNYLSADEIKAANKLRVFVGHGVKDNVVEYKSGFDAYTALKANGNEVFLFSFDGAHRVPVNALNAVKFWLDK